MSKTPKPNFKIPWLTCALVTLIVSLWSIVTPLFEFPDEQVHMETVEYVAAHNHIQPWDTLDTSLEMVTVQTWLGTYRDAAGNNRYTYHPEYHVPYTTTLTGEYEDMIHALNTPANRTTYVKDEGAQYPPAYYYYESVWLRLVTSADLITRAFVIRLGNLLLVFGMAYYAYQIGMLIFAKPLYARTLMFLTFLQPMYTFLSAGTNSDNLHNLLFFAVIAYGLSLLQAGIRLRTVIAGFGVAILDIYTKPQGFVALALFGMTLLGAIIMERRWRLLYLLIIFALATSIMIYPQIREYLSFAQITNFRGLSFWEYLHFSANKLIAQNVVWYWGIFKWLGVVLPPIYWRVANRVVIVGILGGLIYAVQAVRRRKVVASPRAILYLLFVSCVYAGSIFWADWQHHKNVGYSIGIQARYFFPTIVAHLGLLMTGIMSWGWSPRGRQLLRRALILLFIWLQLGGIFRLLSVYYVTSNVQDFIIQLSQYKPWFVKGGYVVMWFGLYSLALALMVWQTWGRRMSTAKRREK